MSAVSISCTVEEAAEACRTTPSQIRLVLLREDLYETGVEGSGPDATITSEAALRQIIDHYDRDEKRSLRDHEGLQRLKARLPSPDSPDPNTDDHHEARRIALVGRGRSPDEAVAKESPGGYAFLHGNDSDTGYHLWIGDLPETTRQLLEVEDQQAGRLPPVIPRLQFVPRKTDKGWRAGDLTETPRRWSRALVNIDPDGTVHVPGVESAVLWDENPEPGFHIAEVWPGIPTDVDSESEEAETVVVRLRETFHWRAAPIDNAEALAADQKHVGRLVKNTASQLIEVLQADKPESAIADTLDEAFDALASHGDVLAQKTRQAIAAHYKSHAPVPPPAVLRILLSTDDVDHALGAALIARSIRRALDAITGCGLDLETDRHDIWEVGLAESPVDSKTYQDGEVNAGLDRIRDAQTDVWIGHNLQDWDLKALQHQGIEVKETTVWDTLRYEALLSPDRPLLALDTAHEAGEDAAVAYRLFRTQVMRLLLRIHDGAPLDAETLFRPLEADAETVNAIRRLVADTVPYHEALRRRVTDSAEDVLAERPCPPLVERLQDTLEGHPPTDEVHVLYPAPLQPLIERMDGVLIEASGDSPHNKHIRTPAAVAPDATDSFTAQLATIYRHDCAQRDEPPTVGRLSPWIQWHMRDHPEWIGPADPDEAEDRSRHRAVPLGAYAPAEQSAPDHVILISPELSAATSHQVVETYENDELEHFITEHHLWAKFDGAGSYCLLEDEQVGALELSASAVTEGRFWLERMPQGRYAVHHYEKNKLHRLKEAAPDTCTWTELEEDKSQASVLCVTPDASDVSRSTDQQRLAPPTRQRARYWTGQALLLQEIASEIDNQPIVLLTQDVGDLESVRRFFRRQGAWHVPEGGTLRRRLELASDGPSRSGLVILPLERWPELLLVNPPAEIHLVVESLPIKKQQATRQSEVSSAALGGLPTEGAVETESSREEIYEDAEPQGTQNEEDNLTDRPYSLQRGLHLVAPLLASLARTAHELSSNGDLRVLDPRVAPIDLPGITNLDIHRVPAHDTDAHKDTLEEAERYFASPSPADELELPKGWQETLARVFLPPKDDGSPGEFYPESQEPYLEPIMRRDGDVLVELPTGTGKSVLFQAPALYHGLQHGLLSIVVTPLKALMVDQVRSLHDDGFLSSVEFINSDLPQVEIRDIYRRIASGSLSLVYVTPERFRSRSFVNAVESRMWDDGTLCYFIFDEVHTVSMWGLDFRPDFLRAKDFVNEKRQDPAIAPFPCLMLSATITEQIYEHIEDVFDDYASQSA